MVSRGIGIFCLALAVCHANALCASESGYRYVIDTVEGLPGERVDVVVQGSHERSVQGFSFAARFPAEALSIDRVHFKDTILEAIGTDYFEVHVDGARGEIVIGALADGEPPFSGAVVPAIGRPLPFFTIEVTIDESVEDDVEIVLANDIGDPPIDNLFVVDNFPVPVDELTSGTIDVPTIDVPLFVRGDVTLDFSMDVSDPIALLDWKFRGGSAPACLVAADANDDDSVDISDAIYLLGHLFLGGSPLPPPSTEPGADPTPGPLGCDVPMSIERRVGR